MKKISLFCSLGLFLTNGFSQTTAIKWFGNSYDEYGISIVQTYDGGFIIAGNTWQYPSDPVKKIWLVKTDWNGDSLWTKIIPLDTASVSEIIETPERGFALAGGAHNAPALIKTDSLGNLLWYQNYSHGVSDLVYTSFNTYVLVGSDGAAFPNCCYPSLIRTDSLGNQTSWYGFGQYGRAYSVVETADSNLVVSWSAITGPPYPMVTKFSGTSNAVLWGYSLGTVRCECSMDQAFDGSFLFAGVDYSTSSSPRVFVKTDSSGNFLWKKSYGNFATLYFDYPGSAGTDGYIITGKYLNNLMLLKTTLNGDSLWMTTYGDTALDYGTRVIYTNDNRIAAVGTTKSYGNGLNNIFLVIADSSGHVVSTHDFMLEPAGIQLFPNPASVEVTIQISFNYSSTMHVELYSIEGEKIFENLIPSGQREINLSLKELPPGIYFAKVSVGENIYTKKIIKMQ